jgi:branched-chain amino acid transport system ATP-binding protein
MLEATAVRAGYGRGPDVVHEAALSVRSGEIVALTGLNGAGKSTLVRAITGLIPTRGGQVRFDGDEVTSLSTDQRARRGLVLVPEGRELCPSMTVEENLELGTVPLPRRQRRSGARRNRELVRELFPILAEKRRAPAGSLSGGQQQMVAIGRALMSSPRLLVLDEPSLGLAPLLVLEIFAVLTELNRSGLSVLVVEQNAAVAIASSHRAYHLELGVVTETDAAAEQRSLLKGPEPVAASASASTPLELPEYQHLGARRTTHGTVATGAR